ncbi:hypothetical protein [Nodularia spumigena]|uniref:hypothetical protein n=1 Tax=Nodularia spumigena TaxID=70799 RepID=UPI001379B41A|nr:hypothetical protein [Nodularia spumigena]
MATANETRTDDGRFFEAPASAKRAGGLHKNNNLANRVLVAGCQKFLNTSYLRTLSYFLTLNIRVAIWEK